MTQKVVAERLGITEATLSRWLNETQIQSRAMDNLMRVFFSFPSVRNALSFSSPEHSLGTRDVSEIDSRQLTQKIICFGHEPLQSAENSFAKMEFKRRDDLQNYEEH